MQQGRRPLLAVLVAAAALLAACGGGGDPIGPKTAISRVVVAGDSLADSGTFGARFTVQNSADPANPFPVFSEIVARNFDVTECPFFVATSATNVVNNPTAGCTNFAVGGGRIRLHDTDATPDLQQTSVPFQLATAGQAIGTYAATDLVLVDGGGNDAADLVTAFLGAGTGAAGLQNYQRFLSQQLDAATLQATLAPGTPAALAAAAGLYMQKLADTYYDAIKVNALDRGATHVAVLNVPDVTLIPALQPALAAVSNANGGGTAGATAAATFKATVQQWLQAFNTELAARVGSDSRVAIVPFFADITEEIGNPASFALTNVTGTACSALGANVNAGAACTSAALDAAPPAGLAAGWWRTWAFADPLHPTPFGHQLLAASVNRALARAGWL